MGFLNGLSDVSSAASSISPIAGAAFGLVNGVHSLFSNPSKTQYEYQRKLNEQQQQYARENYALQLQGQYDLTRDNPLLQKEGYQRAGLSAASLNGSFGNASSTSPIASPNAGAAPSGLQDIQARQLGVQSLTESASMINNALVASADARLKNSQADTVDINNRTAFLENVARLNNLIENTKDVKLRNEYQEQKNALYKKYGEQQEEAKTNILQNESTISDAKSTYAFAREFNELQNLIQQRNEMAQHIQLMKSQGNVNKQQILNMQKQLALMDSQIADNYASASEHNAGAGLKSVQTSGQELQNSISTALAPYVIESGIDSSVKSFWDSIKSKYDSQPKSRQEFIMRGLNNWDDYTTSQRWRVLSMLGLEATSEAGNALGAIAPKIAGALIK